MLDLFCLGIVQLHKACTGKLLASVGIDDQNTLALHDWRSGDELIKVRTGGDKVFGLAYHPNYEGSLVTCGHNHMTFWTRVLVVWDFVMTKLRLRHVLHTI